MNIQPLGRRILFRPDTEEVTNGGIIRTKKEVLDTGTIVAINPDTDYVEEAGMDLYAGLRVHLDPGTRKDPAGEDLYYVMANSIAYALSDVVNP